MVLGVPPQRPSITVTFATAFGLALVGLLVAVRQHVAVPAGRSASEAARRGPQHPGGAVGQRGETRPRFWVLAAFSESAPLRDGEDL